MKTLLTLAARSSLYLLLFVVPLQVAAQGRPACQCKDRDDLINALNEADAAADALDQYRKNVKPTDQVDDIDKASGKTNRVLVREAVQTAMSAVHDPQAHAVACAVKSNIGPVNAKGLNNFLIGLASDYRSYGQEILRILNSLPTTCRPDDWFGVILTSDQATLKGSRKIDPKNQYEAKWDKGGQEDLETIETRVGNISIRAGTDNVLAVWTGRIVTTSETSHKQMTKCESRHNAPDVAVTRETDEKWELEGGGPLNVDYSLNTSEDGRTLDISVWLATIELTGTYRKLSSILGGCGEDADPVVRGPAKGSLYKVEVTAKASIFPGNPEKVSGSAPIKLPASPPEPGMSVSHNGTITFHLYRFHQ